MFTPLRSRARSEGSMYSYFVKTPCSLPFVVLSERRDPVYRIYVLEREAKDLCIPLQAMLHLGVLTKLQNS